MIHILQKAEVQEIKKMLQDQFGIPDVEGIFIKIGEERIFLYQGSLSGKELIEIAETVVVERVGIYFAKIQDNEIRLSIDGADLLKNSITKRIHEISEKEVEDWMCGKELENKTDLRGFVIIKHKSDFLGTGKASENKITNFIPKQRRLKERG